jgi:predicted P-loop ATPase
MATTSISIYKNIHDSKSRETIHLETFLQAIQSGKWEDQVNQVRVLKEHDERQSAKKNLPYVTISGIFNDGRSIAGLSAHSGFISMDLDNLNNEVEGTRQLLSNDPYVFACFTSVSGTGLCVLFKIDPDKHKEAFEGIADYLIKQYQLIVDPSGKDVSRPRYVSFDPHLYHNESALKFKKYLPKLKAKKIQATIFVQDEFERVIGEMANANVSCVEDYRDWRDIGFGLADQFGEGGRQYYHILSSASAKYQPEMCDRQYTHCLRGNGKAGNKITIATIYWYAKQAGIQTIGEKTKKIAAATSTMKKAGLNASAIADNLRKFEGITDADSIIQQAFAAPNSFTPGETLVENIRMWLRHNYQLKRNAITRKIENNGKVIDEIFLNTIFLDAKVLFDELTFELFLRVILSSNTEEYNPFLDFIKSGQWDQRPRIEQLAKCINSNTGDAEFRELMLTKWIVGIVHSIMGYKNELNFILVGGKNTGKTEFFRQLLPPELKLYFAESQLNRGKDDEILMCEKLIIFNDEYGGKNKTDERNEKRLMATDEFTLREPYGKSNVTLKRIASLCGTCNEKDVLDDPTGNRRIIVLESAGKFDYELYNSLDKSQIFFEAYTLWLDGERPVLKDIDIACLEEVTDGEYSKVSFEEEMLQKWFLDPEESKEFMTTSDIKVEIEHHTKEKININKLGARLRKLKYERVKRGGKYGYVIDKKPSEFFGQLPLPGANF